MGGQASRSRVHAVISGRVQGVAFRWYTRDTAVELGLTGWVRNLADGTVEMVAEGPREKLEKLMEWCRQGPSMAKVNGIRLDWKEDQGEFDDFKIRH